MKFVKDTTWDEVFANWEMGEGQNTAWTKVANRKGWPSWASWREFSMDQLGAKNRDWKIYEFTDPLNEIPDLLLGPFPSWQSRVPEKNAFSFKDLLAIPEQFEAFREFPRIQKFVDQLPFDSQFIGLIREDNDKIVLLEGHHRAASIALVQKLGKAVDFSQSRLTIAIARLPKNETPLLYAMLARGSTKEPAK